MMNKKGKNPLKRALMLALALAMVFTLAACGSGGSSDGAAGSDASAVAGDASSATEDTSAATSESADSASGQGTVRIGTKDFTENLILGELYALALEDKGGLTIDRKFSLASSAVHQALIDDEIDLYPEYTGTGLLSVLQLPLETDAQKVYDTVKKAYKEQFDLVWLSYAAANDGQGLAVTKEISDKYGIKTISDLQKNAENIRFISQGEFDEREDGIPGLEKVYGPFKWKSSSILDNALKYTTLKNGDGDAIPAYTTEGNLVDQDFVLLEDDKHVWPPYNIAPVVRAGTLESYPQIEEILDKVDALIDTPTITQLNAQVDIDKKEYAEVAKEYYDAIKDKI
ncbi:MAG: glycine/betaine ABC transporter substrate-binding protein [Clostridiales Family XIII bacterium]|nr:glycine/betaine ABC transporter substrate-binding protein [Clostridiales Family XIII bacterium]